jgi:hypothetical protein
MSGIPPSTPTGSSKLVVQGWQGQQSTANLFEVKMGASNTFIIDGSGGVNMVNKLVVGGSGVSTSVALVVNNGFAAGNAALDVRNTYGTVPSIMTRSALSQTTDILQLQDSNGIVLSGVASKGALFSRGTSNQFVGLATPVIGTASTGSSVFYVVTATNSVGETVASTAVGMANASSTITWAQVPGATGYKIYRNTTNAFASGSLLRATITNGATVSFTDNNSATTVGLPPTSTLGTGLTLQGWQNQTSDLLQAKDSTGAVLARIDPTGNLTVASAIINGTLTVNGHIITGGSTPSITAGVAACTSPTVSVSGNDTAGKIIITTGSGCASTGRLATITFAGAFSAVPRITLTPGTGATSDLSYFVNDATLSTSLFDINTNTQPTGATQYVWYYHVIQ